MCHRTKKKQIVKPLPKFGTLPDQHLVPDVLEPGLKVVFCGTALGYQSAMAKAYYANPGNFFWRTIHTIGLVPEKFKPQDYRKVLDYGIGLTDLCKLHFGNDNELPKEAWDAEALRKKIEKYQPAILAFTSKTGASTFLGKPTGKIPLGFQEETVGRTRIYVLPSPSGQARIFWNQDAWQNLADAVKRLA